MSRIAGQCFANMSLGFCMVSEVSQFFISQVSQIPLCSSRAEEEQNNKDLIRTSREQVAQ